MTEFRYAYTPPDGEVWTDEAIAGLVGQRPVVTGLAGVYAQGEILAAGRNGDSLDITVRVPDDVLLPLPLSQYQ